MGIIANSSGKWLLIVCRKGTTFAVSMKDVNKMISN